MENWKAFFFRSKQPYNHFLFLYIRSLYAAALPKQSMKQLRELKGEKTLFKSTKGVRTQGSQLSGTDRWTEMERIHGLAEQTQGALSTTETSAETENPKL